MKPISRRDPDGGSVWLIAAESLVVSGLLLLGVYVLWGTGVVLEVQAPSWMERAGAPAESGETGSWMERAALSVLRSIPWQPVAALFLGLAAYWALQALGRDRIAFWSMALATALPHGIPAWSHNRIGWQELLELQIGPSGDRSMYGDMTLFVLCLVGLVTLHRIAAIKRLERRMVLQGVELPDRRKVLQYESVSLMGLVVAGLLLAGLMVFAAAALARYDALLDGASLAILTVGGAAALLLAATLLLWFRGRQDARR